MKSLRVVTYNVHGCVGTDRKRSEARIARVLAALQPDIVGLQELDLGRQRSRGVDQAGLIAESLGYERRFHPAMQREDEHYGDAILSRWPMEIQRAGNLPSGKKSFLCPEIRGALWVKLMTPAGQVHVINTHLGLGRAERREQATALAGSEWVGAVPLDEPLLLLGDLNSFPKSAACQILRQNLSNSSDGQTGRWATFPTFCPVLTLDYIFCNASVQVKSLRAFRSTEARRASDHFPLVAEIMLT